MVYGKRTTANSSSMGGFGHTEKFAITARSKMNKEGAAADSSSANELTLDSIGKQGKGSFDLRSPCGHQPDTSMEFCAAPRDAEDTKRKSFVSRNVTNKRHNTSCDALPVLPSQHTKSGKSPKVFLKPQNEEGLGATKSSKGQTFIKWGTVRKIPTL